MGRKWRIFKIKVMIKVLKSKLDMVHIIFMCILPFFLILTLLRFSDYNKIDFITSRKTFDTIMVIIIIVQAILHIYMILKKKEFFKFYIIISAILLIVSVLGFRYVYVKQYNKAKEICYFDMKDGIENNYNLLFKELEKYRDSMNEDYYKAKDLLNRDKTWYEALLFSDIYLDYLGNLEIIIICAYYVIYDVKQIANINSRRRTKIFDKI